MAHATELDLFGGSKRWSSTDWVASDDRVRGGKSQSYLDCTTSTARFHGTLDIQTLGGAGFASQRTTTQETVFNLGAYDGLKLDILIPTDSQSSQSPHLPKKYTLILKDTLPASRPDSRDAATINYEHDFAVTQKSSDNNKTCSFVIPWSEFHPTYRGKPKKDARGLDTKNIRRFCIMMRSFFGDQEGEFELSIKKISAVRAAEDVGGEEARKEWDFCD